MAGTQEAGFLTSICPIQTFPAVIVIRNGMLQEYLAAGTAKDAFQARLKTAVSTDTAPVEPSPPVNSSDTTFNAESQAPSHSAGNLGLQVTRSAWILVYTTTYLVVSREKEKKQPPAQSSPLQEHEAAAAAGGQLQLQLQQAVPTANYPPAAARRPAQKLLG